MQEIQLSIITVCWNSVSTIEKTFQSILNQKDVDFSMVQYIVIDGQSSDGTVKIIEKYQSVFLSYGIDFEWVSESDNGIYDAMNKGIKMAKGKYIGIINSDDTYTESALKTIINYINFFPNVNVFHGVMRYMNQGNVTMIRGMSSETLYKGMIEHPTCFVSAETYRTYGAFSLQYEYVADYELMIRLKKAGCSFFLIEEIIANFDENGAGNSYKSRKELLKLKKKYKLESNVKLFLLAIKYWIRHIRESH